MSKPTKQLIFEYGKEYYIKYGIVPTARYVAQELGIPKGTVANYRIILNSVVN